MIATAGGTVYPVVAGAGIGAAGMLLLGIVTLYFQQRNRGQDRHDAAAVQKAANAQGEISAAFAAWQQVSAANTEQIASLTSRLDGALERLDLVQARAEKCENETVPELTRKVADLTRALAEAVEGVPPREPT